MKVYILLTVLSLAAADDYSVYRKGVSSVTSGALRRPSSSYGAPAQKPSASYRAPAYIPSSSYGAPAYKPSSSYGAAGVSSATYSGPIRGGSAPQYGLPHQGYGLSHRGYGQTRQGYDDGHRGYDDAVKSYEFEYAVNDPYSGSVFAQSEKSDGKTTSGSYTVNLPDGRVQHVQYTADGYSGYNADVSYSGEAQHPVPSGAAGYGGSAQKPGSGYQQPKSYKPYGDDDTYSRF